MASLAEIRARLKQQEKGKTNFDEGGSLTFPHWDIPEDTSVTLRFLPDADQDNIFFWKERQQITLDFPGVKGGDTEKTVYIRVPCVEMYGDSCPILAEVRPWWKDPSLEDTARKYWKKRSYFMQGFVIESTLNETNAPENPIRKFVMTPQIFNIIKAALLDPDMEHSPADYENGTNFVITKTAKGKYNDYNTSKYARKETPLTDEQLAAIEQHGLFTLGEWLPSKPDAAALNAIFEMFEASVNGDLYDPERWGQYYRPFGLEIDGVTPKSNNTKPAPVVQQKEKAKVEETQAEVEPEVETKVEAEPKAETGPSKSASDILAKIRSRNAEA